ncbi:hypothetical protein CIRG_10079 [Coccidioides immitis RMSCC 2394]|uniref:Uncharacterized protein n=1 Tax=Coccidioides immitis RMSCC 2394 TaxID=404692 RepID=A0A0J6Y0U9_COCIT|nr:hypothetical protein CIRG_10079 [Coccidioides immitis RMSCC 2394]
MCSKEQNKGNRINSRPNEADTITKTRFLEAYDSAELHTSVKTIAQDQGISTRTAEYWLRQQRIQKTRPSEAYTLLQDRSPTFTINPRTLQENLQQRTNGARHYKEPPVKLINKNKAKRVTYGQSNRDKSVQNFWRWVMFTDEAHVDPGQIGLIGCFQGGILDGHCSNVEFHRAGMEDDRHPISAQALVLMLKQQLDTNLDQDCTPMGGCGSYGVPFKITCATYGYTVVGKGTTSRHWKEVSRGAEVYRVLQPLQESAVPVFLGRLTWI